MQTNLMQKEFAKILKKNLGEYHDFCIQSDTLLLVDTFNNFWNMCLGIYGLDNAHFFSTPGLAWQGGLKIPNKIRSIN